jgi:hypothetical protein
MVKAMKKASAPKPAPKKRATTTSRTNPKTRLRLVAPPMIPVARVISLFSSMMRYPPMPIGCRHGTIGIILF